MSTLKNKKPARLIWKPGTMLYPLPAVMVSCGRSPAEYNIITIAWTGILCTEPPLCHISIRPERASYDIIRQSRECVINLTTAELAPAVDWCGVRSGRQHNKFKAMRLTPLRASKVHAPLIAEAPINLECRVSKVVPLGSHHMFICEIVAIQADARYVDQKTSALDLARSRPLIYCHGKYYQLGSLIGKFGFSVKRGRRAKRKA